VNVSFDDLKNRTQEFALRVIHLTEALPSGGPGRVIGKQLLRSGTSVGANYRSACRARSRRDFLSKMGITLEEADESAYWLELVVKADLLPKARVEPLLKENDELVSIFVASLKTARQA
jgi:four helix bundle protein